MNDHTAGKISVYPGETIATEMWKDGDMVSFRARVGDRVVLNNGYARIT